MWFLRGVGGEKNRFGDDRPDLQQWTMRSHTKHIYDSENVTRVPARRPQQRLSCFVDTIDRKTNPIQERKGLADAVRVRPIRLQGRPCTTRLEVAQHVEQPSEYGGLTPSEDKLSHALVNCKID